MSLQTSVSTASVNSAKLPVQYESACRSLAECSTIDEAKFWDNKADALAAWAKIYRSDQAAAEAKRLKLHAYRRMGALARDLRPHLPAVRASGASRSGFLKNPGAGSLLRDNGLSKTQSTSALRISRLEQEKFNALVELPRPPSVTTVGFTRVGSSANYEMYVRNFNSWRAFCRKHKASEFARGLTLDEAMKLRGDATEMIEWLDEFEQFLPKQETP